MSGASLSSVQNALRVLRALSEVERGLGVTELASRLGIAKSTCHRLLSTLAADGFVQQHDNGRYALGLALWELGSRVVGRLELREVAHPILEELRNSTGETIHLAILDGESVVYIDRFESESTLTLFRRIGFRAPAHVTSTGKAILAFSPPEVVERVLNSGLRRVGPGSITSKKKLLAALDKIRSEGCVVSVEESEAGVASVGAPVFDHSGSVVGSISLAGPTQRIGKGKLPPLKRQIRLAAQRISRGLGYPVAAVKAVHD